MSINESGFKTRLSLFVKKKKKIKKCASGIAFVLLIAVRTAALPLTATEDIFFVHTSSETELSMVSSCAVESAARFNPDTRGCASFKHLDRSSHSTFATKCANPPIRPPVCSWYTANGVVSRCRALERVFRSIIFLLLFRLAPLKAWWHVLGHRYDCRKEPGSSSVYIMQSE